MYNVSFFFSSRRRHTRSKRDWSSDVCSSDLLLETRSMSVSEVAYEVGFSAPSYFTKCFKEEYGMLPGDVGNVLGNN